MNICGSKILIPKIYTGSVVAGCKTITEQELKAIITVQELANKGIELKFDDSGIIEINPDSGNCDHITTHKIVELLKEMRNAYKNSGRVSNSHPACPKRP